MTGSDTKLILGANHTERLYASDLGFLDFEISRKDRTDLGEKNFLPRGYIRSSAHNSKRLALSR